MATICTTTTLDCPTYVLLPWISYHLNIGIDHMFLFFDNPSHPGIAAVENHPRITVVRCDGVYWPGGAAKREKLTLHERQWYNANKALQWARERNFDWIVHIDSDELLYYPGCLHKAFEALPKTVEVVRFRVYEAIPEKLHYEHPFAEIRYFRVGPIRPTKKTRPLSWKEWMQAGARVSSYYLRLAVAKLLCPAARGPFLRGHIGGKSAVRTDARIQGMGVHLPAPPPGHHYRDFFLPGGALLHYDCSDFDSWLKKWRGRAAERHVPRNRDRKRKKYLAKFLEAASKKDPNALVALFCDQYMMNTLELRILELLGLIRRIVFPDNVWQDVGIHKLGDREKSSS